MPKLSPTMEEGQLSRWLKNEGDPVSVGEPIAEIDTDKATMEAQALTTGFLRKILVPAGETVPLGQIIAIIGEADEDISALISQAQAGAAPAPKESDADVKAEGGEDDAAALQEPPQAAPDGELSQAAVPSEARDDGAGGGDARAGEAGADEKQAAQPGGAPELTSPGASAQSAGAEVAAATGNGGRADGRVLVSPIAARMAADANINVRDLAGSGPGGRVVKRDIEAAIKAGPQPKPAAAATPEARPQEQPAAGAAAAQARPAQSPAQQPQIEGASPYRDEPVSTMRAVIARRLAASIGPVPHFFLTTEIEMERAADLRRQLNELDPENKVSVNDIVIKVAAAALIQHPSVNASFQDKTLRFYERADIGVAVAIDDGLITPVVRAADRKSIGQIGREVRELAERARARKLKPEEYTGATFSVSNLGMFGIDEFTAVINPPEAAILAVGQMAPKAVVRDGQVVARQMMRVTMSCDHRVIDGATGAKFLQTFRKLLENPLLLLL